MSYRNWQLARSRSQRWWLWLITIQLYKSITVENMTVQNAIFVIFLQIQYSLFKMLVLNRFVCFQLTSIFVAFPPPSSHWQSPYLCISCPVGFLLEQKQLSSVLDCPDAQSVLKVGQTGQQLDQDPDLYWIQRNSFLDKVNHLLRVSWIINVTRDGISQNIFLLVMSFLQEDILGETV